MAVMAGGDGANGADGRHAHRPGVGDWATPTLRVGALTALEPLRSRFSDRAAYIGRLFIYLFSAARLSAYARRIFFGKVLSVMSGMGSMAIWSPENRPNRDEGLRNYSICGGGVQ